MAKLAFIGIDVGTSGIKAIAVDLEGNILASHNEHLNIIIQKPGWTEQNPLEWWTATIKSLKAISLSLKSQKIDFLSIGLSGQMHSLVILDKNDNSLDNAILWNDGRTDTNQLGMSYQELEEAMRDSSNKNHKKYLEIRKRNLHKMNAIPVCKMKDE